MGTGIDEEALNKIPMGILVLDGRNLDHIVFASHMAAHIWACEDEEELMAFCEGHLQNAIYLPDMWRVSREMKQAMKQERNDFQSTFRICTRTGILRFVHLSGRREEREGSSLFYTCVTEHNEDESDVDTLTGLFGPMQFASRMNVLCRQDATSEEEKYAVLAFNIEKFRLINERFGMQEGDLCLKILADILSQAFIEGIVCRTPVDSFYVLIRIDQMDHALNVFRNLLAEQMRKEWNCVVNIGGCLVPSEGWKPSVCMDHAMQACRSLSRFNGKRFAWYDKELAGELTFARYIEGHLDEAIQKGWIKAYYQPVVRPVNMALCSMGALVRWDDPNYGFLTPGRFIRILEEKKQIDKLDKAMVSLVCREYEERVHQGKPVVPVSFNLSRYDFLAGDIVSYIESEVRAHHVPKDMIHVEITESMMVSEGKVIASAVRRLHEAGYQVWMDDFGSGYSSLNLLKDYDFDKIKLDMAFFSTFTQKSKHIVMSMVRMIKELHSQTLAEGVETREEFEFLKRIGCERVQGYYLGKPAPYDETLDHVRILGARIEPRPIRRFVDKAIKTDFLQDTPMALVVIPDIEELRKQGDIDGYNILKRQNIRNLMSTPLYYQGKLIGFLVADNYEENEMMNTRYLLETVGAFMAMYVVNQRLLEQLEFASGNDSLTGVKNRNALDIYFNRHAGESQLGVFFIDVNGLKYVNDTQGHAEGDRLLQNLAEFLCRYFSRDNIYRSGGDEFVIVIPGTTEEEMRGKTREIKDAMQKESFSFAIGYAVSDHRGIQQAAIRADQRMYQGKREYYQNHSRYR